MMTISTMRASALRFGSACVLFMLALGFAVPSASAHTEFVRSNPAPGATLAAAPADVSITFSGMLDPAGSSITVVDATGASVSEGATTLSPTDAATMRVALRSGLGAGTYTVQWTAQADDGHILNDSFTFTVGATAQPAAAPARLPATGALSMTVLLAVVAVMLVVLGIILRGGRLGRGAR